MRHAWVTKMPKFWQYDMNNLVTIRLSHPQHTLYEFRLHLESNKSYQKSNIPLIPKPYF